MKVQIGIPTYNGAMRLDWLLQSIAMRTSTKGVAWGITIVDDGSPRVHETRMTVNKWSTLPIKYIEHGTNKGISAAWNTAARSFETDIVVLINDDVIVSSGGWLASLVHCLEHSPQVGVVGQSWHGFVPEDVPGLLAGPESDRNVVARDPFKNLDPQRRQQHEDTNPGRVMCPTGQLFAFRRKDFDTVGGFDERMLSFYEESSFGTEMAARGMIGAQLNWPFCWHLWSETFKQNPELESGSRMGHSRNVYRQRWQVPDSFPLGKEFDYTNPKYLGAIGDVPIEFLRRDGSRWKGVLRQDGAFVDGHQVETAKEW